MAPERWVGSELDRQWQAIRRAFGWVVIFVSVAGWLGAASIKQIAVNDEGFTPETAIQLSGVSTEPQGMQAERAYVARRFPTSTYRTEILVSHANRVLDRVELIRGSQKQVLYFDITPWFGRY